jgi:phosphotriesterase-related protein
MGDAPVRIDMLGELKRDPFICADNLKLNDSELAVKELLELSKCGGRSVVCQSLPGAGRDPVELKRISQRSGVNIVTCTGWYIVASHPASLKRRNVEDLYSIMTKEIVEGIGTTGIRAGAIGECGCSEPVPLHPQEKKVLQAAGRTQAETGVGLTVHPAVVDIRSREIGKFGQTYLDLLEREGADLGKFFLSHSDWTCSDRKYQEQLLQRGITLSYDSFGLEAYYDSLFFGARNPTDIERIDAIVELCKVGYERQIMLSQDVCMKMQLKRYGGYGYSHAIRHIIPMLETRGVTRKQIRQIVISNPRRMFSMG